MNAEIHGNFPPGGDNFYRLKVKPQDLQCCTPEEFRDFRSSVKVFCEIADSTISGRWALCAP